MSWSKGNLILGWTAAQDHPALAEVRFQVLERLTETWEIVRLFLSPDSNQPGEKKSHTFILINRFVFCCREWPTPASKIQHVSSLMLCLWKERKFSLGAHPERSYPHWQFLLSLSAQTRWQLRISWCTQPTRSKSDIDPFWSWTRYGATGLQLWLFPQVSSQFWSLKHGQLCEYYPVSHYFFTPYYLTSTK